MMSNEELFDQLKRARTQRTFDFISQLIVCSFVAILLYYNGLMLLPFIMPLFWAVLWAMFLKKPIILIHNTIECIDKKLGSSKLHIYLGSAAIYTLSFFASSLMTIIISSIGFALWSFILWGHRRTVSTTLLFISIIVILALPIYFSVISCIEESKAIATRVTSFVEENPQFKMLLDDFGNSPYYKWVKDYALQWGVEIPEFDPEVVKGKISEVSMQFTGYFTDALGGFVSILSDSLQFVVSFITFISFLFTFLSSDTDIFTSIMNFSPFSSDDNAKLLKSLNRSVVSVFMSSILVSISHTVGTYLVFKIIGIELSLVLSVICGFTSVLPLISSWIVWIPVSIGLFLTENYVSGAIVIISQVILQGPVDNAIYGLIPGNSFLVSTSLAMGLYVFGTIGLIMGPLLAGFSLTVLEIYKIYQSPETVLVSQHRISKAIPALPDNQKDAKMKQIDSNNETSLAPKLITSSD